MIIDNWRNYDELESIIYTNYAFVLKMVRFLIRKGVIERFKELFRKEPGRKRYYFGLVRKYRSYKIISGIENVLCHPINESDLEDFNRNDLGFYFNRLQPFYEVDDYLGNLYRGSCHIDFITRINPKYNDYIVDWLMNTVVIDQFKIHYVNTVREKINKIKEIFNDLNPNLYNMLIDDSYETLKELRQLANVHPIKKYKMLRNDLLLRNDRKNMITSLYSYYARLEYPYLKIIYNSWIKRFFK